jgi:hypothetical protein
LEYASEVWDNCGQINSDKLEKVQLEVARFHGIVTGLPPFASINSMYIETGWEKLKTRKEERKLVLFYKIVSGQVSDYPASSCTFSNLSEFIFPQLSHTSDAYSNTDLINAK